MKKLLHYTSLLVALKILKNKTIKFSPIKKSNDLLEASSIDEMNSSLVFCTSKTEIDALTWIAYSKGKDGAAIQFNFKEGFEYGDLFLDKDIDSFKVEYVESYYEYIGNNIDKLAYVKEKIFKKEDEYRYLIKNEKVDEEYRIVKINEQALASIDLFVSIFAYDIAKIVANEIEKESNIKINVIRNEFIN